MKYLLFAGQSYYPLGGCNDFVEASNDIAYLKKIGISELEADEIGWWHIMDVETGKIVCCSDTLPYWSYSHPEGAEVVE